RTTAGREAFREGGPQGRLLDLAHAVARHHLDDLELLGNLLGGKPLLAAVRSEVRERERLIAVAEAHHCAGPFAGAWVGQTDDGNVGDGGVEVQVFLDLRSRD